MSGRRKQPAARLELAGALWVKVGDRNLGGRGRMALLREIAQQGSITQAAKAYGMSYKAAWDAIDLMNTLAGEALVERVSGGRGGGSTRLTERGRRLVDRFDQVDAAHARFLQLLDAGSIDLDQDFSLLRILNMKTSARNQFLGTVSAVRAGAVNDEVELTLANGAKLVAVITRESSDALGLRLNRPAIALIKSSSVLIATDLAGARISARNQLGGTICDVTPGAVNSEITLDMDGGDQVVATITVASVKALALAPGVRATALVKASDVIIAVTA